MGQWIRKLRQWTVFRSTDFITICFFASILSPFLSPHHSKLLRQSFFFCCGGKDWNASGSHRRKRRTCSYRTPPSVDKCFYVLFLVWVAVQSIDCFDIWGAPSLRKLDIFKFRKNMLRARSRNCLREMCDHFLCARWSQSQSENMSCSIVWQINCVFRGILSLALKIQQTKSK